MLCLKGGQLLLVGLTRLLQLPLQLPHPLVTGARGAAVRLRGGRGTLRSGQDCRTRSSPEPEATAVRLGEGRGTVRSGLPHLLVTGARGAAVRLGGGTGYAPVKTDGPVRHPSQRHCR